MAKATPDQLYTLKEVAKETGISMPTLERYKVLYRSRIPSQGTGSEKRYPEEAIEVFQALKDENIGRRGRPKEHTGAASSGKVAKGARKPASRQRVRASQSRSPELLTLTEVSKQTGISYPTLLRYVKTHLDDIPHKGDGRSRRYLPEAIQVFERLRDKGGRSRKHPKKTARRSNVAGTAAPRKHIAKPATASEIMKATGLRQADLKKMRKLLRNLGSYERLAKYLR